MFEEFRDITGFEGLYQVSNLGRVKSIGYGVERILKPVPNGGGYQQVKLCKNGKQKRFLVHRLVAQAFLPNPNNYPVVNHKDENPLNNVIVLNADGSVNVEQSNLEWCTREYNNHYGTRIERVTKALINGKLSKPVLQFTKNGELIKEWVSTHEVQRVLEIAYPSISDCCLGKRKTAGGYVWRYA